MDKYYTQKGREELSSNAVAVNMQYVAKDREDHSAAIMRVCH